MNSEGMKSLWSSGTLWVVQCNHHLMRAENGNSLQGPASLPDSGMTAFLVSVFHVHQWYWPVKDANPRVENGPLKRRQDEIHGIYRGGLSGVMFCF